MKLFLNKSYKCKSFPRKVVKKKTDNLIKIKNDYALKEITIKFKDWIMEMGKNTMGRAYRVRYKNTIESTELYI